MTRKEVRMFLITYNKWRRGCEDTEMPDPRDSGLAIDYAIKYLSNDK